MLYISDQPQLTVSEEIRSWQGQKCPDLVPRLYDFFSDVVDADVFSQGWENFKNIEHQLQQFLPTNENPLQTLWQLRHFYFDILEVKVCLTHQINQNHILIPTAVNTMSMAPITASLLFMHFARKIGLKVQLLQMTELSVIRWTHENKIYFLDLLQKGKVLTQEELLEQANHAKDTCTIEGPEFLTAFDGFELVVNYLSEVSAHFSLNKDYQPLLRTLDFILEIQPDNLKRLSQRALLLRELGQHKESLIDLKRYFSFVEKSAAPVKLKMAYYELTAINSPDTNLDQ